MQLLLLLLIVLLVRVLVLLLLIVLLLTAGASAPEELVEGLLSALARRYTLHIREIRVAEENVVFKLPREVA